MGFQNATQEELQRWSQTLIDGTGNYADDPDVWAKAERSSREVDAAIDEMLPSLRENPDHSLLSGLAHLPPWAPRGVGVAVQPGTARAGAGRAVAVVRRVRGVHPLGRSHRHVPT